MNPFFELKKDKDLREDNRLQPFKIVSLWEVIPFYADSFVRAGSLLFQIAAAIDLAMAHAPDGGEFPAPSAELLKDLEKLRRTFIEMTMEMSTKSATRLLDYLRNKSTELDSDRLRVLTVDLFRMMIEEFESRHVMGIPPKAAHYYEMNGTFLGESTLTKFRELRKDAEEAGNCFALGRQSACVFHLMRIMEMIVHRFGNKPQVKIRDLHKKTWGQILNELDPKITSMKHDTQRRQRKKDRYRNCYALLDAVNRSVRVPTMHTKLTDINRTYNDDEAQDLMARVKRFVEDFAELR